VPSIACFADCSNTLGGLGRPPSRLKAGMTKTVLSAGPPEQPGFWVPAAGSTVELGRGRRHVVIIAQSDATALRIAEPARRDRRTIVVFDSANMSPDRATAKMHAASGLPCITILLDPGRVLHRLGRDLI
jgi:hypothetical protein